MKPTLPSRLYGIADASFGDPVSLGRVLAAGGARVVQLRAKGWSTAERVASGRGLVEHLRPLGVLVIMNDDLEAAVRADVDGLHLGLELLQNVPAINFRHHDIKRDHRGLEFSRQLKTL